MAQSVNMVKKALGITEYRARSNGNGNIKEAGNITLSRDYLVITCDILQDRTESNIIIFGVRPCR